MAVTFAGFFNELPPRRLTGQPQHLVPRSGTGSAQPAHRPCTLSGTPAADKAPHATDP